MTWSWLLWLAGWALAADALRRPAHRWTAADRSRSFWVPLLVLFAPIMFLPYLIAVLPRLAAGPTSRDTSAEFLREH